MLLWAASASPRPCNFLRVLVCSVASVSFSFFVYSPLSSLVFFVMVPLSVLCDPLLDWSWPALFLLVASLAWFYRVPSCIFATILMSFVEGFCCKCYVMLGSFWLLFGVVFVSSWGHFDVFLSSLKRYSCKRHFLLVLVASWDLTWAQVGLQVGPSWVQNRH